MCVCVCVCGSYVGRVMWLTSIITTNADEPFIFSGEHLFTAVTSTPLNGDYRPVQSDDDVDSAGADLPFIEFNISSTSSGRHCRVICAWAQI